MKLPAAPPGEISVPLRTPFGRVFASPRPRVAGFLFYSNCKLTRKLNNFDKLLNNSERLMEAGHKKPV